MKKHWIPFSTAACAAILTLALGLAMPGAKAASSNPLAGDPAPAALSATTAMTATTTRSDVGGVASALAVTDGSEIGTDFRLSSMGPDGNADYDALNPAVAYNSTANEYLVVWSGSDGIVGKYEIWGQRVNAATGAQIGADFQIGSMGPGSSPDYDANTPDVAYNSANDEYLVVWSGDHYTNGEFEIWARRVSADGTLPGSTARVSVMGGTYNPDYDATDPAVAYNSTANQYLIVWEGDDTSGSLANNEFEIWGQRVDANLGGVGSNDFRISDVGTDGDADRDALDPAVAYNSTNNQYLVVWEGDDIEDGTYDVLGQRLAATGSAVGANDFYLSHPSGGSNTEYDALNPAVAYDQANNEYLVVWQDDELGVAEFEIWGQQVNAATGGPVGGDTRLSDMGTDGNADFDAQTPALAYSGPINNQYLIAWSGDDSTNGEFEIWGQRFTGGYKVYLPLVLRN